MVHPVLLVLDPNTAEGNLKLSTDNRKAVLVKEEQPVHPERLDSWKQVLCSDGLTGCFYWEVRWTGTVTIGVTYKGIRRKAYIDGCCIGWNQLQPVLESFLLSSRFHCLAQ